MLNCVLGKGSIKRRLPWVIMPTIRSPRKGSLQYWPRKRARRETPRVRAWAKIAEQKLIGFAGYKAGMANVVVIDSRSASLTKGQRIVIPATVVECPPLKVAAVVLYKKTPYGLIAASQILADKMDKELGRRITMAKKTAKKDVKEEEYDDIRLLVYTQPKATGLGKKKPELFEVGIGGKEKLKFALEKLGKEILVQEVLSEGQTVDVHSVTKAKGFQGPVKRFGIGLRSHKSEKSRRAAILGSEREAQVRFYAQQAGQVGYHTRTEHNKQVLKIGEDPKEVNPEGGFVRYGIVKNNYVLLKGSIGGPAKRMVRINAATRPNKRRAGDPPKIVKISLRSQQGL